MYSKLHETQEADLTDNNAILVKIPYQRKSHIKDYAVIKV